MSADWIEGLWLGIAVLGVAVTLIAIREAEKDADAAKLLGVNGPKVYNAHSRKRRAILRGAEHGLNIVAAVWQMTEPQVTATNLAFKDIAIALLIIHDVFVIANTLLDLANGKRLQLMMRKEGM